MKSIALATILLIIISLPINAEITLDGTLGRTGPLPGPNYLIGAELGQQHGRNLFHSFRNFNLKSHESATFTGPNRVNNIIGRVTGGNPSNIDGLIRSTIPNANLYFLNPNGILFGPNAKLDVQGSFHASTADYLRLQDGGRFEARQPNNSLLTVAPVEAFGFLDNTIAPISVKGGGEISKADWDNNPTGLSVPIGKTLSLLGGELEITTGTFFKTIDNNGNESTQFTRLGSLNAPEGQINLASVASKGEIVLGNTFLEVSSFTKLADMYITNHSLLQVSGEGGGRVFIRGEQVLVDDSAIEAKTLGIKNGSLLDIQVGSLSVAHNGKFDARLESTGTDAIIKIKATDSVSFFDRSSIDMNTYNKNEGAGDAGTVLIEAKNIYFEKNAGISNSTLGKGHAGTIIIRADELFSITKTSSIYISPFSSSTGGTGGTLFIEAQDIRVEDGSYLSGTTFGPGNGGDISIYASGTVTISEANPCRHAVFLILNYN
jgi:filamentous hemagglutinin family protein